jgi:RNA polymerase sigma-70 factor (ECF subfamily)
MTDADQGTSPRESDLARAIAERRPDLLAFVRGRVHDLATAEDLVNDTLVAALSRVDQLRDDDAVVAWIYRALRNRIVDQLRRRGTGDRALERLAVETESIVEATEHAPPRVCRCVTRVAASLKPEYAEALERIEVDGEAVRAFAAEHGISSSNAAVRVFRAREALRRGVIATCGACAAGGCADCTCEDHAP